MTTKDEALRLADSLERMSLSTKWDKQAAAAAPELLEALKLALHYWMHRQQRYKNRSPVWVQYARAAIAKATGENT